MSITNQDFLTKALRRTVGAGVLACALMANAWAGASPAPTAADVVFTNAAVYTVDPAKPWAQAVAVKGKHIVYVGDEAGLKRFVGPDTRSIDLNGKMLLPGFVESHMHPIFGAVVLDGVDFNAPDKATLMAKLRERKKTLGRGDPLVGFGWHYEFFPGTGPTKEELDALFPEQPVLIWGSDGYTAWVNSHALALARQNAIELPEDFPTTGFLSGLPEVMAVLSSIAPISQPAVLRSSKQIFPKLSAAGITTVFDAGIIILPEDEGFDTYRKLEASNQLPFRVIGSHIHENADSDPVASVMALAKQFDSELVSVTSLKLFMDGVDTSHTAAMLAPYHDDVHSKGKTSFSPEEATRLITRADAEGIDVHIHSFGDSATRQTLDAIEAATRTNAPRDRRHSIAHLHAVDPADIVRFKPLNVIAQFSAQWAAQNEYYHHVTLARLGTDRAMNVYPMGAIKQAGGTVSLGTDWPASTEYTGNWPLNAIEVATTRLPPGNPKNQPAPPAGQTITLADAIYANTLAAAYQLRMDDQIGSITTGKLADLVVLDKDLFKIAQSEIHRTEVLMTMMNGTVRHDRL